MKRKRNISTAGMLPEKEHRPASTIGKGKKQKGRGVRGTTRRG